MSRNRRRRGPSEAVRIVIGVLAAVFLIGLISWFSGLFVLGTVLMLVAVYSAVAALLMVGGVIAAGLRPPAPFAQRNLLTSRLAWIGRTVWAAIVLASGGYFGAIIALDLASPRLRGVDNLISYSTFIVMMLVVLAAYVVVVPIAIVTAADLIRAGVPARRAALRRAVGPQLASDAVADHLASAAYSWATLIAMLLAVPLTTALVFWIIASTGIWNGMPPS